MAKEFKGTQIKQAESLEEIHEALGVENEFKTLSEKAQNLQKCGSTFPVAIWFEEDIKEFIQWLNELMIEEIWGERLQRIQNKIDKRIGPKLITKS